VTLEATHHRHRDDDEMLYNNARARDPGREKIFQTRGISGDFAQSFLRLKRRRLRCPFLMHVCSTPRVAARN